MIEVKYKNTEEQYLDFSIYRAVNSKSYKRSVKIKTAMISAMLIISSIVYAFVSINRSSDEKIMKVGFVFSGIFFVLGIINIFVFKKYIYRTLKKTMIKSLKNSDIFGKTIKVRLDGESLEVFRGKSKLKLDMDSLLEIKEVDEYIWVSVRNHIGLVIPTNAFKRKQDREDFVNAVKLYIEKNK